MVTLGPNDAFTDFASKSHRILSAADPQLGKRIVTLGDGDHVPNKDFILAWRPAGKEPEARVITARDHGDDYLMLFVQPPADVAPAMVRPKEMVFLIDRSGSMWGEPLDTAKAVIVKALRKMGPDDTFQLIAFDSTTESMSPASLPNNAANIAAAERWLGTLRGGGGTEMLSGIRAALDQPYDPKRLRMVVFCTDGFIGNEKEIIDYIGTMRGQSRVFGFGIGSSVNRYLVEGVARAGRGAAEIVRQGEPADEAVAQLYRRLDRPVLTDVALRFSGRRRDGDGARAHARSVRRPAARRRRQVSRPRPRDGGGHRASSAPRPYTRTIPVTLASQPGDAVLGTLWARRRIDTLTDATENGAGVDQQAQIVELALKFKLITAYTSFVAVEKQLKVDTRTPLAQMLVPNELPEGVSYKGIFAEEVAQANADVTPARVKPGDPEIRVQAPAALARARDAAVGEAPGARGVGRADGRARRALPRAGRLARWLVDGDGHDRSRQPARASCAPSSCTSTRTPPRWRWCRRRRRCTPATRCCWRSSRRCRIDAVAEALSTPSAGRRGRGAQERDGRQGDPGARAVGRGGAREDGRAAREFIARRCTCRACKRAATPSSRWSRATPRATSAAARWWSRSLRRRRELGRRHAAAHRRVRRAVRAPPEGRVKRRRVVIALRRRGAWRSSSRRCRLGSCATWPFLSCMIRARTRSMPCLTIDDDETRATERTRVPGRVSAILPRADGALFIGTFDSGLYPLRSHCRSRADRSRRPGRPRALRRRARRARGAQSSSPRITARSCSRPTARASACSPPAKRSRRSSSPATSCSSAPRTACGAAATTSPLGERGPEGETLRVTALAAARGRVWIGTPDGVYEMRARRATAQVANWHPLVFGSPGATSNVVTALAPLADGVLAGTDDGGTVFVDDAAVDARPFADRRANDINPGALLRARRRRVRRHRRRRPRRRHRQPRAPHRQHRVGRISAVALAAAAVFGSEEGALYSLAVPLPLPLTSAPAPAPSSSRARG